MSDNRYWIIALAIVAVVAAAGGYFVGQSNGNGPPAATSSSARPQSAQAPAQSGGNGRILYYRNPMGLPDTSPVPRKDAMGMDYVPVYENEAAAGANVVQVSPDRVQMLGVRTAPVQLRAALARMIPATGVVQFDERRLATVTTKVGGWIEKLHVAATGEQVRAGEPLAEIYAPDLVTAERDYLVVAQMGAMAQGNMTHGDPTLVTNAALSRLRALDVPQSEIDRLRRTGKEARDIAVFAPANGIVTEKDAVLGMHIDRGMPLYKTADLSTVWLIAQVQEQDLGDVRAGEQAHASFVAFPGRIFDGVVDFIYPTLSADTRTARVRIAMPNRDLLLREAMYATVAIETPATQSVGQMLVVPDSAVIDSGTRQVVLVARGQGRFEPRAVRTGAHGDGYTQVRSGLKTGEQVVTSANFLIDAESNLRAALQSFTPEAKKGAAGQAGGNTP